MAINVNCPACQKLLSVKDEYAGRVGRCPGCGGEVHFPQPTEMVASTAAPQPFAAQELPDLQGYDAPAQAPGIKASAASLTQIGVFGGMGFAFLMVIACFLGWLSASPLPLRWGGFRFGDGRLVMGFSLLTLAGFGLTMVKPKGLPTVAVLAAGFGLYMFLFMLGHFSNWGIGILLGVFAAMGLTGASVFVSLQAPWEFEHPKFTIANPVLKKHLILFATLGIAFLLGLIALIVHMSATGMGSGGGGGRMR